MTQNQSVQHLDVTFDVARILSEFDQLVFADTDWDNVAWNSIDQFSLRNSGWFAGVGSLVLNREFVDRTENYTSNNPNIFGSYLSECIDYVEGIAKKDGVKIGRVRCMRLKPKSCLTLHCDIEEFRYHVPLKSSYRCFFVENDQVVRMPIIGGLYRFRTNKHHTAINASFEDRLHLVFDTF